MRRAAAWRRVAVASSLLVLGSCGASAAPMPQGGGPAVSARSVHDGDWTRFDFTAQRSGVGPTRTGITRRNLHALKTRVVGLDGTVDSSPIQLHRVLVRRRRRDVIFVTTTYGRTLAISAQTGRRLWQFTPRDIGAYVGGPQITNTTPVADPDRRYVYAASPDGFIHKLRVSNGRSVWATKVTLDPAREKLGTALNIDGHSVVATTGGYDGDAPPYQGHVVLIDRASGRRTHVWNSLCSHRRRLIRPPSCPASGRL